MNEEKLAVIVIIAHKQQLSPAEQASLRQCYAVLGNYRIVLICPEGLDVSAYREIEPSAEIRFVDPKWQSSYAMFNRMKIEPLLYRMFRDYRFLLFYELDAWVFRDELKYWCDKNYDYIGAPWFEGYHLAKPGAPCIGVGNGGFSLRKIATHLKALRQFAYIRPPRLFYYEFRKQPGWKTFRALLRNMTIANNVFAPFNDTPQNEDHFWYFVVSRNFSWYKVAPPEEALKFSVETNPSFFIHSEEELPFGCHAWQRYDPAFWSRYIPAAAPPAGSVEQ